MKGLAAAAAAVLVLTVLASSVLPAARTAPLPHPALDGTALRGGLLDLPDGGTLVIDSAHRPYSTDEAVAVHAFVAGGGRLLVTAPTPAAASLLQSMGLAVEAGPALVFDPDVDGAGRFAIDGTGVLGASGRQWVAGAQTVTGDGEAVVVTRPFAWRDADADGRPEPGEPRGAWAVARLVALGRGEVLVLGTNELLDGPLAPAVLAWVGSDVLVDQTHRTNPDALGLSAVLAGHRPAVPLVAGAAALLVALLVAWRISVYRHRAPRATFPAEEETLQTVGELEV